MRRLLVGTLGFRANQIMTLTNAEATRANILKAASAWLVDGSRPGDRIVLFYSGHGYYQTDDDGDETDGLDEAIVPHDAEIIAAEEEPMKMRNLILDDEIDDILESVADRRVILIVDSCFSGTMSRALAGGDPRLIRTLAARRVAAERATRSFGDRARYLRTRSARQREGAFLERTDKVVSWSAVSPVQQALVDVETEQYQGVFTGRFVRVIAEKLADRDGDGKVSHAELHDYLLEESKAYCERNHQQCNAGLTPYLEAPRDHLGRDVATGDVVGGTEEIADSTLVHDNVAGVAIEILPSTRVRVGQELAFRIRASRPGHLLVIDVNAKGELTQLFPNKYADAEGRGGPIAAGRPITIPDAYYGFRFTAGEPLGRGKLFAVLTEDPVALQDLMGVNKDLQVVADPAAYLGALAERLRRPWQGGERNREAHWSMSGQSYEITR